MKKAIALISGVIFIAIILTAVFLMYQFSVPIITNMKISTEIERMKSTFITLDNLIETIISEGEGSRRILPIKIDYGELKVDEHTNKIIYSVNARFPYISPRSQQFIGNIKIGSNLNTIVNETIYNNQPVYVMENEHLKVYIRKIGNETSPQIYTTNDLLVGLYQKDLNKWFDGSLEISIDNETASKTGTGYTIAESIGSQQPYGKIVAFINTTYINYYIEFILESGADFMQIRGGYYA